MPQPPLTALPFATSITEVHLGRLRGWCERQAHHLPSFRNKWQAPNLVGARLIRLPASVRWRVRPTFSFFLFSPPWIDVWDPCQSCWSRPQREAWSGFGWWSTALYSGERAGGTAWWKQLSPRWLQQPTWRAGELVDSAGRPPQLRFIPLEAYWWSKDKDTLTYNKLGVYDLPPGSSLTPMYSLELIFHTQAKWAKPKLCDLAVFPRRRLRKIK